MILNKVRILAPVLIALCFVPAFGKPKPKPFFAKVTHIYDGDSLRAKSELKFYEIRLASIDAPEYNQNYGKICRAKLASLIENKTIKVKPITTDRYKRIIADIEFENKNINREMVETGCAWAYRKYLYDFSLIALEKSAQKQKIGLWSQPKSQWIPPWIIRN